MDKREKVIKGLECCLSGPMQCEKCPYKTDVDTSIPHCVRDLRENAIELLKTHEPRVLTLEEAEKVPEGKIVWVEQHTREKDYLMPMAATGDGRFGNFYLGILWKEVNTRFYRMWASKPTDEQREAVKWDG